jgi:hypothetical protein
MSNIVKQGKNVIKAHLEHLKGHGETKYLKEALDYLKENGIEMPAEKEKHHQHMHGGCPGSRMIDFGPEKKESVKAGNNTRVESSLRQWPVQITLVPPNAPYFKNADILIAADCVPFAYANFHEDLLRGKILLVGCPKLDNIDFYSEKLSEIFRNNDIKSVTYAHMEVPCCYGLVGAIQNAIKVSGKKIPFEPIVISIKGERAK